MGIYLFLKDNKDVKENSKTIWNNLLKPYIDQRIFGKPQTLCKQEFQWMLEWCLHLERDFTESVKAMIGADKDCDLIENQGNFHTDIFHYLNESDLFKEHANTSGELVEHLLSKGYVSKWDNRELKQTIQTLEENGCKKSIVSRIRELAIGLGIDIESD